MGVSGAVKIGGRHYRQARIINGKTVFFTQTVGAKVDKGSGRKSNTYHYRVGVPGTSFDILRIYLGHNGRWWIGEMTDAEIGSIDRIRIWSDENGAPIGHWAKRFQPHPNGMEEDIKSMP